MLVAILAIIILFYQKIFSENNINHRRIYEYTAELKFKQASFKQFKVKNMNSKAIILRFFVQIYNIYILTEYIMVQAHLEVFNIIRKSQSK